MSIPDSWVTLKRVESRPEALALCEFLEQNSVPTYLEPHEDIPGLETGVTLAVPETLLHRAEWVIAGQEISDEELAFLATGELSGDAR